MREAQILSIKTREFRKEKYIWRSESLNRLNRLDKAKDTISELEGGYEEISQNAALKIEMKM